MLRIGEVAKQYDVSNRTLRYWEEMGILASIRAENGYRYYDSENVARVNRIALLRKVRMPIAEIEGVFIADDFGEAIDALERHLIRLKQGAAMYGSLIAVVEALIGRIAEARNLEQVFAMLETQCALPDSGRDTYGAMPDSGCDTQCATPGSGRDTHGVIPDSGCDTQCATPDSGRDTYGAMLDSKHETVPQIRLSERVMSMSTEQLGNVRIVSLPAMTVAAYRAESATPEDDCIRVFSKFVLENNLHKRSGYRNFGFNNPSPSEGNPVYGYEMWVTVPEDFDVPEPLVKKQFGGGLYASISTHMNEIGERWKMLYDWCVSSDEYEADFSFQWFEECVMDYEEFISQQVPGSAKQLDLLSSVKRKQKI